MKYFDLMNQIGQFKDKTVFVYQSFDENIDNYLTFDDLIDIDVFDIVTNNQINFKEINKKIISKIVTEDVFKISFEQYLLLDKSVFNALLQTYDYTTVLINNNLFSIYYPLDPKYSNDDLLYKIDSEKEFLIQSIYSEHLKIGEQTIVSFSDYSISDFNRVIDIYTVNEVPFKSETSSNKADYIIDSRDDIFTSYVVSIINENKSKVILSIKKTLSTYQKQALYILESHFDVDIYIVEFEITTLNVNNSDYLDILHRRNKNYQFFDLNFYRFPGETLELIKVNQNYIIDRIVSNAKNALDGSKFNDIFVTASTGAGKSLMFQIPSIYLAEKYNMLTIVVTPLIGLMNDQVNNIQDLTSSAATINSDYTPDEKNQIKVEIKESNKSILYISPEALLSNPDITSLIGDRKIGLFVIDEAHIVATWGKSFRPDYWFLGDYINYLRTKSKYTFPIATFSATISYGGTYDMHRDIIDSLKMRTGRDEYIGPVRRDDISFDIKIHEKESEYQSEKNNKVKETLADLVRTNKKTIAYFPYVKQTQDFKSLLSSTSNSSKVSSYTSKLVSEVKNTNALNFKNGDCTLMLATKAFGMGIDIKDIEVVYHYAPTGNLMDYVQEIGRAARDKKIQGIAKLDYFHEDFRFMKQLYGLSSIKNYQVIMTLKKLKDIYTIKNKRNFTISAGDFTSVFANERSVNLDDVDMKLKTTLLLIQKDFEMDMNLNYKPIIFKPRSMFTIGYVLIKDDLVKKFKRSSFSKYFSIYKNKDELAAKFETKRNGVVYSQNKPIEHNSIMTTKVQIMGDIYRVDFKKMWEDSFSDLTFGQFKRSFYLGELKDFSISEEFIPEYLVILHAIKNSNEEVINSAKSFLYKIMQHFDSFDSTTKTSFHIEDLMKEIQEQNPNYSATSLELIAKNIILGLNLFSSSHQKGLAYNQSNLLYQVSSFTTIKKSLYEITKRIEDIFSNALNGNTRSLLIPFNKSQNGNTWLSPEGGQKKIYLIQLLDSLGLIRYEVKSGESPEYFVRLNGTYQIDKIISNPSYHSRMVQIAYEKHEEAINIQSEFFTELKSDKERWDFIERYFVGLLPK